MASSLIILYPTEDASVALNFPDTNYGSDHRLIVHYWPQSTVPPDQVPAARMNAYIMFDLSSLDGLTIISASLELYAASVGYDGSDVGTHYCSDNSWDEDTITGNTARAAKEADLNNTFEVENLVLNLECKNKTRNNYFMAYQHYCDANEIDWIRPNLKNERFPVKIPTEERINMVISSATSRYATIFHFSKMGLRPDEISKITLRDINLDRRELVVRTSKLGLNRTLRLSIELTDLLIDFVRAREWMVLCF